MIQAGLTGGIATGKSTVSKIFEQAGAAVIDADTISHFVTRQGMPAWQEIVSHFGPHILEADGEIDRSRLGPLIFNDDAQKEALNRIVHPQVRLEIDRQLAVLENKSTVPQVVILDIPLLIEVGWHRDLEEVILVYTTAEIQLKRLMTRDRLSENDARQKIKAQMPIDKKKQFATIIIDNQGNIETTRKKTLAIYAFLLRRDSTSND